MSNKSVPKFNEFIKNGKRAVASNKISEQIETDLPSFEQSIKEVERLANEAVTNKVQNTTKINEISEKIKAVEPADSVKFEKLNSSKPIFEGYHLTKDKDEIFECNISVEGTTLGQSRARLVFDTDPWNLTFYGKIDENGNCKVPIRKGVPLLEGTFGKVRLEVIVEDQLFIGWESDFIVEVEKKLNVNVFEKRKINVTVK